ncbi:MAG TPA: prepilin-type N-terminal cleavage/methylation domain-containing protein, partial [Lacipirellulaceae bacterium]|nr:prepilin-type N-terminal cleavage/methylation domain-containing protein [Lacipirellulaceae bacterium]
MAAATYPYGLNGYLAYPLASGEDSTSYRDASNSVTGGYSATAPGNSTAPFDAQPWAIGVAAGLAPGDPIPGGTTFSFSIDLDAPGVLDYVQHSLAAGGLGFMATSKHLANQPGVGGVRPYPQWFMSNTVGDDYNGEPPTLQIEYEIAPPGMAGDFDGNGVVDGADLLVWQRRLGAAIDPLGPDDLNDWRSHFLGSGALASQLPSASAAPEPTGLGLLACGAAAWLALAGSGTTSRRRPKAGFTLVELLVVIAIIGALIAML